MKNFSKAFKVTLRLRFSFSGKQIAVVPVEHSFNTAAPTSYNHKYSEL